MLSKTDRSARRKRQRELSRQIDAQLYEENAQVLASLIQHSPVSEDEFMLSMVDSRYAHEDPSYFDDFASPGVLFDSQSHQNQQEEENFNAGFNTSYSDCFDTSDSSCNGSDISEANENGFDFGDELSGADEIKDYKMCPSDVSPEVWSMIIGERVSTAEGEFKSNLASWSKEFKVKRNAIDRLLHLLKSHGHSELPACAKTLLKTPRHTKDIIFALCGGQFWYRGIKNALMSSLSDDFSLQDDTIELDIFIDGINPHKSVKRSLWPIAGCVKGQKVPFVIALWCGASKEPTSVHEFFEDFVNEAEDLLENGVHLHGKTMRFKIKRYLADAPARAWMRCVKGHNAYNSCERCTVPGEWKFRRVTYNPAVEGVLRTDSSFEQQTHKEHHTGISPLLRLGTGMISQCPLDTMHMVYLGCTRRIFALLLKKKTNKFKLTADNVQKLDNVCTFMSSFCPSDFARKPRPLSQWKLFKATEYRRLLLYDGFILHKAHKHKDILECHLLLACGMRIILDAKLRCNYMSDAHELLTRFVERSYKVLGASFVVYNIHHLTHLTADCMLHGDPEEFSCFKYENHLGDLKTFLTAPGRTLPQIVCRMIERSLVPTSKAAPAISSSREEFLQPHFKGPTLGCNGQQYALAKLLGSTIRICKENPKDSVIITSAEEFVVVENIVKQDQSIFFIGRKFLHKCDFFQFPFPSSVLGIYEVSCLGPLKKFNISNIAKKAVFYPVINQENDINSFNWREGRGLCVPLLHSEVQLS